MFEPEDVKDCLEKIKNILLLSSKQIEDISKNAVETAEQYTWDKRAKDILDWYNKSCG